MMVLIHQALYIFFINKNAFIFFQIKPFGEQITFA